MNVEMLNFQLTSYQYEEICTFITDTCPPGTFNDIGLLQCIDCNKGFYQDEQNQLICLKCPSGQTTATTRATQCGKTRYRNYNLLVMAFYHSHHVTRTGFSYIYRFQI